MPVKDGALASAGGVPRVLVTDAERGSALAVIRSIGRLGWPVIAAAAERDCPGFRSRYATGWFRYPDTRRHPDHAAEAILEASRRWGIDLVVPVTDEIILPLVARRDRLPERPVIAVPDTAALEVAWDKGATLALATQLGVPVPRTVAVGSVGEAVEAARGIGWPVVLKPRRSRRYRAGNPIEVFAVAYAADPGEVARSVGRQGEATDLLVQEFCPGECHGVELLFDRGRPLVAFQHRRLREVPVTGGASAYRESVALDELLLDYSTRLLGELEWTGLAMVEFRLTPGGPRLMEINGRVWGSLPLAVMSGIDFPAELARLLLGGAPTSAQLERPYRIGVRAHSLPLEVAYVGSVLLGRRRQRLVPWPSRTAALRAAASLLRPGDRFDVASRDDPRPALAELALLARRLVGRLARAAPLRRPEQEAFR